MCRKIDYNKDIDSIKEIWKKYHEKESCKTLIEEIQCSMNETYINEKDGEVKAFLTIRNKDVHDDKANYIFEFYAAKKGEGYGEKLLKDMQDEREFLCLHANKKEPGLIDYYEGKDFKKKNGTVEKYYMRWDKRVEKAIKKLCKNDK
ncbi:MAG: hypothetical protein JW947_10100 [Sedimentisphaerales bacterium]|nr:hypothetical protein [Sedimentisphaerales bacterium]